MENNQYQKNNWNKHYNGHNNHYYHKHNGNKKFYYYHKNNGNKKFYYYHKKHNQNVNNNINNNVSNQDLNNINNNVNDYVDDNILLFNNNESLNNKEVLSNSSYQEPLPRKNDRVIDSNGNIVPKMPVFKMALGIILLVAIVFGVSYSYFTYYQEDSRQADISMGEVYVRIPNDTVNITLNKLYPRTNVEARAKSDNYVDFTVNAKNTSPSKVLYYNFVFNNGDAVNNKVRINPQYLKVDLQEKVGNEYIYRQEAVPLSEFNYRGMVPVNTNSNLNEVSEITKEYRLRIWVSDNVIISDTDANATYNQSTFSNLFANFHVSISSYDSFMLATDKISAIQTLQADETEDNVLRYVGANVNNYVSFNNGELWRIIGVYNDHLKIVRANKLSNQLAYNSLNSNEWNDSDLKTYLLNTYYPTLSNDAKAMVFENGNWYIGTSTDTNNASEAYSDAETSSWQGKIGLIASYEYLYAASSSCWETSGSSYSDGCASNDWLFKNSSSSSWTITPNSTSVLAINDTNGQVIEGNITDLKDVYPVVYLKSDVTIVRGTGQASNPYILKK